MRAAGQSIQCALDDMWVLSLPGFGAPQPIFCKARVITAWLADVATGLIEDEDYQTENLTMLAQCMCLDSI